MGLFHLFCVGSLLLLSSTTCFAQQTLPRDRPAPPPTRTILKTNPLGLLWGSVPLSSELRASMEFVVNRRSSYQIAVSYMGKSPLFALVEDGLQNQESLRLVVHGLRGQAAYRFYPKASRFHSVEAIANRSAPEGWYVGPHISYASVRFSDRYNNARDIFVRVHHFNMQLTGGYQFFWGKFAVDLFSGMGYKRNSWVEHDVNSQPQPLDIDDLPGYYRTNFKFSMGFEIGYQLD